MSMTKRELLLAVCEQPGYQLPDPTPSSLWGHAEDLVNEGWVTVAGMGSNELTATPKALDHYPDFLGQADIAAPAPPTPLHPVESPARNMISQERLHTFVYALLSHGVPLNTMALAACSVPGSFPSTSQSDVVGRAARDLVEIISAG